MSEDFNNPNQQNNDPDTQNIPKDEQPSSVEYDPYTGERHRNNARLKARPDRSIIALFVAIAVVLSLLCGVGGVLIGGYLINDGNSSDTGHTPDSGKDGAVNTPGVAGDNVVIFETTENAVIANGTVATVAEKSAASVVEIMTTTTSSYNPNKTISGAGSGVIIAESAEENYTYIITNNHVIEGYETIRVRTTEGKEYAATVVGTDWLTDIAVLRIEVKGLSIATFASSDHLVLGQEVVAIGNPLGSLGGSVTNGIISGLSRTISIEGIPMTLLQTNAAINPGNSGGGLFDMNGNLIGIVNAKSVGEEVDNIGFAIPAATAKETASQIIAKGYVEGRADLGFMFGSATTNTGLTVYSYAYNSEVTTPIEQGHILYAITTSDGTTVEIQSIDDYRGILAGLKIGETVQAVIYKPVNTGFFTQYKSFTVTLTVHEYVPN